jgi:hypothetical protein
MNFESIKNIYTILQKVPLEIIFKDLYNILIKYDKIEACMELSDILYIYYQFEEDNEIFILLILNIINFIKN